MKETPNHNFWVIEILEEIRRVANAWGVNDLQAELQSLVKSSIVEMMCERPILNFGAATKTLIFVALKRETDSSQPSEHYKSPRDEIISSLKDLARLCREIGEPYIARKIGCVINQEETLETSQVPKRQKRGLQPPLLQVVDGAVDHGVELEQSSIRRD